MTRPTSTWGSLALLDWRLVRVQGALDLATAPILGTRMSEAVPPDDPTTHLIVDLEAVTFLDCSGLGTLVATRNRLGDRLLLRNPSPPVSRLLQLTDLTETFAVLRDPSPAGAVLRPV